MPNSHRQPNTTKYCCLSCQAVWIESRDRLAKSEQLKLNHTATPDTTKLFCPCRVRLIGSLNWIPDNSRLSPTENLKSEHANMAVVQFTPRTHRGLLDGFVSSGVMVWMWLGGGDARRRHCWRRDEASSLTQRAAATTSTDGRTDCIQVRPVVRASDERWQSSGYGAAPPARPSSQPAGRPIGPWLPQSSAAPATALRCAAAAAGTCWLQQTTHTVCPAGQLAAATPQLHGDHRSHATRRGTIN